MKIAYLIKKNALAKDARINFLIERLRDSGISVYPVSEGLCDGTDMLLSFGGDGTFLSAASIVCAKGIPLLGVNLGRLGFLSDSEVGEVADALVSGEYTIEDRTMLQIQIDKVLSERLFPFALNEVVIRRMGSGTIALDAVVDGEELPTYWADGLLLSTSSGSTAYSLSVGGPICRPDVSAFVLAPIAPHNLNLRPLLLPISAVVEIKASDRKGADLALSLDNRDYIIPNGTIVRVFAAPFALKKVILGKSNFINALRTKLLWGEDVRNTH